MSEDLRNKLDNFVKKIIIKIGNKDDIPEIQKDYDDLIEFLERMTILTNEEFISLDNAMSKYDSSLKQLQEKISIYKSQKDIDDDKIQLMNKELTENFELKDKYMKLNEDYNSYKQKYHYLSNENTGFQMKLKTNEKLISDLQDEISNLKN